MLNCAYAIILFDFIEIATICTFRKRTEKAGSLLIIKILIRLLMLLKLIKHKNLIQYNYTVERN